MLFKMLKLWFVSLTMICLGGGAFLHGLSGWRSGQIELWRKGRKPIVVAADGALPMTFTIEVWSWMIIGAAAFLVGLVIIIKFLLGTGTARKAMLDRLGSAPLRASREDEIPWAVALAIIGAVVGFFVYLGISIHTP
jgi:hypothetical protein